MEQILKCLLAKMDANQAKMGTTLEEMKEEIRTNQAKVDANLKEIKEGMMARLEAMICTKQPRKDESQPQNDGCQDRRQ
jgi:hypothetical protein